MKTNLFILFTIFALSLNSVFAQDSGEIFRVLASKGSNKVILSGSTEEKPLFIGKKLNKGDKIVLSEGCYLGLVHKSGKTIELKKSGSFPVEKLSSEVASQNASLGKKYVDFVVGEMTAKEEDMAKNRHKYMQVTGSVERGTESKIDLLLPAKEVESYVLNVPTTIRWHLAGDSANDQSYIVKIDNFFEEEVFKTEVKGNFAIIDFAKINPKNESMNIKIKVFLKENNNIKSEEFLVKFLPNNKASILKQEITNLKSAFNNDNALNKFVLASFCESNQLLVDAVDNYEATISLAPEVDDFKVAYGYFLNKNKVRHRHFSVGGEK